MRGSPCLSHILPEFESQGRSNIWLEFVAIYHPWGLFLEGPGNYRARGRAEPKRVVWSWSLNESLALASAVKGLIHGVSPVHEPDGYAMPMSPNKGETAVHGCHCPDYMAVRMREVLARPWVGICMYVCPNLKPLT